jgi:cytochrome b subunit of formate dehydrogenase
MTVFWHLIYLFSNRGKQFFQDITPRKKDFQHLVQTLSYNLNLRKEKPRCGRFGYVEKIEYWGLVLGTVVMTISGVSLWIENVAAEWFSEGFLNVMLVFHYYEAWLAILTIVVWHLYSTLFKPRSHLMNPSWLTGKVPLEMYLSEHQDDSALGVGRLQHQQRNGAHKKEKPH